LSHWMVKGTGSGTPCWRRAVHASRAAKASGFSTRVPASTKMTTSGMSRWSRTETAKTSPSMFALPLPPAGPAPATGTLRDDARLVPRRRIAGEIWRNLAGMDWLAFGDLPSRGAWLATLQPGRAATPPAGWPRGRLTGAAGVSEAPARGRDRVG